MRTPDLIRAALGGLWRQKARSTLTLLGVAVGTTALAYTLSLGVGLREFIENEFKSRREFWLLNAHPKNYGRELIPEKDIPPDEIAVGDDMPPDRRDRLRQKLIQDYQRNHPPKKFVLVTPEQVAQIRQWPDVDEVRTSQIGYAEVTFGDSRQSGMVYAGRVDDFEPSLQSHLLWGRLPEPTADEAVVSELMLYRLGLKTDEQMRTAVGRKLRVTLGQGEFARGNTLAALLSPEGRRDEVSRGQAEVLDRIARQLPQHIDKFDLSDFEKAAVKAVLSPKPKPADAPKKEERLSVSVEVTVVGVSRLPEVKKPDPTDLLAGSPLPPAEVLLGPAAEATLFARLPQHGLGYTDVTVKVRPGGDVERVAKEIEGIGLETFNSIRFYHAVKREVTLISAGLNLFAMLSMVVAAIGIMNTLFTSVLERTREIGVLKAVGARDGHILWMFLLEGAAVGLIGGLVGLAMAYLVSIPSDGWVKSLIEQQRNEEMLTKTYFGWPAWLPPAVLAFSVLLTTAAAVFPARRASRVPPVEALRHE